MTWTPGGVWDGQRPGGAPVWRQLRLADAISGDALTPAFDPNSVFSSLTEDAAGWQIALNNAVSVDGLGEGCGWIFDMPPGWVDDFVHGLMFRVTEISAFPDSKGAWMAVGVCDMAGDATNVSALCEAVGIKRDATQGRATYHGRTLDVATGVNVDVAHGLWFPNREDLGSMLIHAIDTSIPAGTGTFHGAVNSPDDGDLRLIVVAGCETALADGPHTGKFRLEVAAIQPLPDGSL